MSMDGRLIKQAYAKLSITDVQLEELMSCMHETDGPMYFMENFMKIQHPMKGGLSFEPYDFQRELVRTYHEYRNSISLISRQMGKSTVAAGYLLWYAMFVPDSTILVASNKHENAMEIMQKIRYAYESLPDHIRAGSLTYNKKSLEFDNNSRIISQATTENTGRGMAISLVYLDEFAFVEPRMARDFWTSLSPTLSTGGKCMITSTPNTDEDQFAEIWTLSQQTIDEYGNETELGVNSFKGFSAIWDEHPERDEEWAKIEFNKIGEERFGREHLCQFLAFDETLINSVKLAKLRPNAPIRKTGQVRWYKEINPNYTYVISLDPSMGTGGDNAAIEVFELPTLKQVAEWQHNNSIVETQLKVLKDIATEIEQAGDPEIYWSVENNTLGEACLVVIRETGEELFPGTMIHDPHTIRTGRTRKGFTTTNKNKVEACARLKSWIESGKISPSSKNLISELKHFVAKGSGYEAKIGSTDDLVSATLLNIRMIQVISAWDDTTYESINNSIADDGEHLYGEEEPMPIGFL